MPNHYLDFLQKVADKIVETLKIKDKAYGSSWIQRGGVGAFMMLARKWDRIENQSKAQGYDIFQAIEVDVEVLDDIDDLIGYLLLVRGEYERREYGKDRSCPNPIHARDGSTEVETPVPVIRKQDDHFVQLNGTGICRDCAWNPEAFIDRRKVDEGNSSGDERRLVWTIHTRNRRFYHEYEIGLAPEEEQENWTSIVRIKDQVCVYTGMERRV